MGSLEFWQAVFTSPNELLQQMFIVRHIVDHIQGDNVFAGCPHSLVRHLLTFDTTERAPRTVGDRCFITQWVMQEFISVVRC